MVQTAALPFNKSPEGVILRVRLSPKSARDEVGEVAVFEGKGVLTAKVRAVPEKGKANAALLELISKWLGVPKSSISLTGGGKSRLKALAIAGDSQELGGRLAALLEAGGKGQRA